MISSVPRAQSICIAAVCSALEIEPSCTISNTEWHRQSESGFWPGRGSLVDKATLVDAQVSCP